MKKRVYNWSAKIKLWLGMTSLLVVCGVMNASAVTVVSDNFNSGVANATLNGAAVSVYNASLYPVTAPTWTASALAVYDQTTSGVITSSTGASIQGLVSVPSVTSGVLTLQADVKVGSNDWIGIGFLKTTNWFDSNNPLFTSLNAAAAKIGTYKNGAAGTVGISNVISGVSGTGTYTLKLVYDLDAATATTYLNGGLINTYSITGLNSTTISYVGFRIASTSSTYDSGQFDNFSYDYTAVPEPSTAALMVVASLGLVLSRRKLF